jgi:hypothetical protein
VSTSENINVAKLGVYKLKHAYLIMAHNNFDLLKILLKAIDFEHHDIYIHIDLNAGDLDFSELKNTCSHSNLYFMQRRTSNWGTYEQVEVEIALFELAYQAKEDYRYYHLLSGNDFLLKSASSIYNYFESSYPHEFLDFAVLEGKTSDSGILPEVDDCFLNRIKFFHPIVSSSKLGRKNFSRISRLFEIVQTVLLVDRTKHSDYSKFQKGQNWCSVSQRFVEILMNSYYNGDIYRNYHSGIFVDELYKQTLFINSNLYHTFKISEYKSNLRYVDWDRGEPYTFKNSDVKELSLLDDFLFVRKLDQTDNCALANNLLALISERQS